MLDRDKVISALHCRAQDLMADLPACDGCDYQVQLVNQMGCDFRKLCRDAIELLKEQEAVEPRVSTAEQRCGHCNKVIEMDGWKVCPWCGKMIDWERWWQKNGTCNQDT